jgi:hypothetical protein
MELLTNFCSRTFPVCWEQAARESPSRKQVSLAERGDIWRIDFTTI